LVKRSDFEGAGTPPAKLQKLYEQLKAMAKQHQFKAVNEPAYEEEHQTWMVSYQDAQGSIRRIDWTLASSPEYRQMMTKFVQIKDELQAPFVIEATVKGKAEEVAAEDEGDTDADTEAGAATAEKAQKKSPRAPQEPVIKQTARELFDYVIEQGRREYQVQRYKGLGEMTAAQLWETTMDPEKRTLLSVKLEDLAETETIFSTLMGEDVEARRKFIEENALDVKNLDI
jgi:DNA gyrase subunit B